jgi:DnaK suppressor protein
MPTKKPSVKPSKAKKTVSAKPAVAKKPSAKAAVKPVAKAAAKKAVKSTAKPSGKPSAAKPVAKSSAKPAAKPATKPITKLAVKPTAKDVAKGAKPEAVKSSTPAPKATTKVTAPPADSIKVKMPTPTQKATEKPPAKPAPSVGHKSPNVPKGVMAVGISEKKKQPTHSAADGEDGDEPGANLLAGPRNVTPYQVQRGEQYMNKEQLGHFHDILHSWKRDLMEEVDRTVLHMKDEAANFPDPNDRATQESEFSLELRTRDRERKLIRKIEEAIARIDDGSYGYCSETGEEIGVKRLEARPVATLCVEAQERRERREKQYGDRDDRYR